MPNLLSPLNLLLIDNSLFYVRIKKELCPQINRKGSLFFFFCTDKEHFTDEVKNKINNIIILFIIVKIYHNYSLVRSLGLLGYEHKTVLLFLIRTPNNAQSILLFPIGDKVPFIKSNSIF